MDETSWSSDFYSDALESFSYINKYSKTKILAFCYWHNLLVIGRRVVKFRAATRTLTWNYSHDFSLNCTPLSPITIIIIIIFIIIIIIIIFGGAYLLSVFGHVASIYANLWKKLLRKSSTPSGFVWNVNMATLTSCENAL